MFDNLKSYLLQNVQNSWKSSTSRFCFKNYNFLLEGKMINDGTCFGMRVKDLSLWGDGWQLFWAVRRDGNVGVRF